MLSWTCTSLQLTSPLQTINDSCPPELCTRIANKLVCRDCIPDNVPNDTEVNLVAIDPFKLVPGRFCNVHWPTVDALSITTADNKYFSLENGTFDCLQHIRSFRMSSPYLDNFDTGTFNGLKNLTEFDLSGCNRMSLVDLRETFSAPENFPSISRIILSSVCFVYPFGIGQEFIDALASKPISYVDLSHNNFQFQFATSGNLCTTLDTLRIRNAEFYCDSKCQEHPKCKSLRVYDMSGTVDFFERMTCRNTSFTYTVHPFFQEARILMSNEVIKEPLETGSVVNCSLRLLYNTQVEEYHFAGNNLPSFEFKFVNNRFKFLNLSHNRIRSINPDTIKHLSSLAILDLSDNYLAQAQEFQGSVSTFFTHSPQLSELDLSMNNLGRLPKDIFISNTFLKVLNLSHNAFDQIHFHFWNLPNLTTLDLSLNRVESFDPQSRRSLDDWYNFHLDRNDSVSILLDGNPFSCACTSVDFIEWFVASPIFASNASGYQCHVDEMYFPMTHAAMDAAHDDCDKTRRKRLQVILSSVLAPVSILIVAVATALLYRKYRKNKEDRLLNDRILLLKRNEAGRKFAVFLSHSSDENEFVREEILKPLQVHTHIHIVSALRHLYIIHVRVLLLRWLHN